MLPIMWKEYVAGVAEELGNKLRWDFYDSVKFALDLVDEMTFVVMPDDRGEFETKLREAVIETMNKEKRPITQELAGELVELASGAPVRRLSVQIGREERRLSEMAERDASMVVLDMQREYVGRLHAEREAEKGDDPIWQEGRET